MTGSLVAICAALFVPGAALALSELKREEVPPTGGEAQTDTPAPPPAEDGTDTEVPLPDPIVPGAPQTNEDESEPAPGEPQQGAPGSEGEPQDEALPDDVPDGPGQIARPDIDPNAPLPEVLYDIEKLPEPVKRMRNLLIEACKTGDIEKLRPLIGTGENQPLLSFGGNSDNPVAELKGLSGDPDGQEILAIMEEVLDAGYVHLDAGKPEELYVWPYFFGLPLDRLTPRQRVEMFKIVTAGDYEDMKTYGTYIFYRLGIKPSGEWAFFLAGE